MRQLAARRKTLVLWYVIDLVAQQADEAGIARPPLPWEDEEKE
jgi:hypothetical protein